jgi:lysozyme family protein
VTPSAAIAPETYSAAVRIVNLSYWNKVQTGCQPPGVDFSGGFGST